MVSLFPYVLLLATAVLVFAAGWRMLPLQNALAGGTIACILFLTHPAVFLGVHKASCWDSFFVMLFLAAWLWLENWSLFMRSWLLAGIFAFGLWVGSPYVLWGLLAMVPWVLFNRRPLAAVGSLATVLFGGLFIFGVTWAVLWFFVPAIGQPLFTQWIRWGGLTMPLSTSLPWLLLITGSVFERFQEMVKSRRSDATTFAAALVVVTGILGSAYSGLSLIAISAPLIARLLAKKEFLLHRRVRWVGSLTFILALVLGYGFKGGGWLVTGLAMLFVAVSSWGLVKKSGLPRFMVGEAVCVGAYLAESLGSVLHIFPRF